MKTVVLTSSSSTPTSAVDGSDSCYFPGCRKDANCTCDICLASINATLDLIPSTARSKISNPKPKSYTSRKTPIPFNQIIFSTPKTEKPKPISSPPLNSTARVSFSKKVEIEKSGFGFGGFLIWLILGVVLAMGLNLGFSWYVSRVLKPELSAEVVTNVIGKSQFLRESNGKLSLLQRELQGLVRGEVSSCGHDHSLWKINQGDLLLSSKCILYKSATEEVSIWGWPLQTAGLLTADYSSRSLTILSGRVTEWSNGNVKNVTIKANQSWVQQRWSASVVQLDQNTWIIEYRQAVMIENSRLISAALEFLRFWFSREINRIKQEFWFLPDLRSRYDDVRGESSKVPT